MTDAGDDLTPRQKQTLAAREARSANARKRRIRRLALQLEAEGWTCIPPEPSSDA